MTYKYVLTEREKHEGGHCLDVRYFKNIEALEKYIKTERHQLGYDLELECFYTVYEFYYSEL